MAMRPSKKARGFDVLFLYMLNILCQGKESPFDGVFCVSGVIVCKALQKLFLSGRLKFDMVIVFPVPGLNYKDRLLQMQSAYDKYNIKYANGYTVVGIRATAPNRVRLTSLFYQVVGNMLRAHVGTVEALSLTLAMPLKLAGLHTFLRIVSSCTSVTDMHMDVRDLIGHDSCTVDVARKVETVVANMKKLLSLSWTGFFFELKTYEANDEANDEFLLYMIPSSLVSLRLAGTISSFTGKNNRFVLMDMFRNNKLPNLRVVDLNAYREDEVSLDSSAHLLQRLCDKNSIVERIILPAQWTSTLQVSRYLSVAALCGHAKHLMLSNKRLTIVISNTDASTSQAQQQWGQ